MARYINKDALVAEIKRKKLSHIDLTEFNSGYKNAIFDVLSFLDTLEVKEVKEVNLEKEMDTWRHNHFHGKRDNDYSGEYLERSSQLNIAKHFFELGVRIRKGEKV